MIFLLNMLSKIIKKPISNKVFSDVFAYTKESVEWVLPKDLFS